MGSQDQSSLGDLIDVWLLPERGGGQGLWGGKGSPEGYTAAPREEILRKATRLCLVIVPLFMHTHKRFHASHRNLCYLSMRSPLPLCLS